MTTAQIRRGETHGTGGGQAPTARAGASGWTVFAAVLMIFGGTMAILQGIAGVRRDSILVVTNHYAYTFHTTSWGWLNLSLGILLVVVGVGLFTGSLIARIIAGFVAGISMVANFIWLPYYPLWAIILIAIDAFIIWAVCTPQHRTTLE